MTLNKIVVAPDSFKGSLSSSEVVGICCEAIRDVFPDAEIVGLPIADGGEGTVEVLTDSFGGDLVETEVENPVGKKIVARYLLSSDGREAVMEMAQASGLCLLSPEERDPLLASTYGVGEMIMDAVDRGCRKIFMGIGGSATNDGGMGMLRALGFRFLDKDGKELQGRGMDLEKVVRIDSSDINRGIRGVEFVVACDVDNPLVGERGASFVFAPQKGADHGMVLRLDRGMRNFAEVIKRELGMDVGSMPGVGAAGGLGGAFAAFLGGRLRSGIDMVLDAVGFDEKIKGADLILTGEGSIDRQSLMGKVLSGVLKRAKNQNVPLVAVSGQVKDSEELNKAGFAAVFPIENGPVSLETAMSKPYASTNLKRTIRQILLLLKNTQ